jgi:hypothetical protein
MYFDTVLYSGGGGGGYGEEEEEEKAGSLTWGYT